MRGGSPKLSICEGPDTQHVQLAHPANYPERILVDCENSLDFQLFSDCDLGSGWRGELLQVSPYQGLVSEQILWFCKRELLHKYRLQGFTF